MMVYKNILDFTDLVPVDSGGESIVYKAVYKGQYLMALKQFITPNTDVVKKDILISTKICELALESKRPEIVDIFNLPKDCFMFENELFEVFEFIPGGSLESLKFRVGKIPVKTICEIGKKLSAAIYVFHKTGFLHRDIKPGNILLPQSKNLIRICDFSSSCSLGLIPAKTGGTLGFLGPEQLLPYPACKASDIYGLCATLYYLFSSHIPYEGTVPEETAKNLFDINCPLVSVTAYNSEVPSILADAVHAGLSKNPSQRPSVKEINEILKNIN